MSQLSVEVNHVIASWWKFQVWNAYVQPCITPLECCSAFKLLWLWLIIITVYFNIMYAFSPSTQTHTTQPLPIYIIGISHWKKSIMNSDEHSFLFACLMYMWKPFISSWVWGPLFVVSRSICEVVEGKVRARWSLFVEWWPDCLLFGIFCFASAEA